LAIIGNRSLRSIGRAFRNDARNKPRDVDGETSISTLRLMGLMRLGSSVVVVALMLVSAIAATAAKDPNLARAEAFVAKQCPAATRGISTDMWMAGWKFNALYGNCRAGDGTDRHIWFFLRGRFIGSDARRPFASRGIFGVWRDGTVIAFMYVLYRTHDPNCCPTGGGKIVRFRLRDGHVVRLDPLPKNR
jgi:hypothetical protein